MRSPIWCPDDLRLEVTPPLVLTERSAANTEAAIEQFAECSRYVKRDVDGIPGDETMCNFFVRETLRAQGVEIPRGRVNDIVGYFFSNNTWALVQPWIARDLARLGRPVVVLWRNDEGPGHIARLKGNRPDDDPAAWYIAQAGLSNFTHDRLSRGFGARPVKFFAHP